MSLEELYRIARRQVLGRENSGAPWTLAEYRRHERLCEFVRTYETAAQMLPQIEPLLEKERV